uniref:SCP domain-containing protein n=1 Tax=Octopus bimaculoides TaxID=37653 RepID=A0A0L8FPD4_OCTBM
MCHCSFLIGSLSDTEEYYMVSAHNTLRRRTNKQELKWSPYLSRWANYIIRCDEEYPGPRSAYTNFGKLFTSDRDKDQIMADDIENVGCAALDCLNFKQLTCIYK